MNMVDNIARRTAEKAVKDGLREMATMFPAAPDWAGTAARHFNNALVGKRDAPNYTADQITDAFAAVIQTHKFHTMPKPADVAAKARELAPLLPMQKKHTDPTPGKKWTDEERARNIAFMDAIMAKIAEQNEDPEYKQALQVHGKGSPELAQVVGRQRAEMQAWIDQRK